MQNFNNVQNGQHDNRQQKHQLNQQPEEIPLQRLTITEHRSREKAERKKARILFEKYDHNHNGFLSVRDLKQMIRDGSCPEMERGVAHHILKLDDHNSDGRLNFEEFLISFHQNKWLIDRLLNNFSHYIIPLPHLADNDQIDGAYTDNRIFCCPPPVCFIFSLVQVLFFVVDVLFFSDYPINSQKVDKNANGPAAQVFMYNPYRRFEAWRFVSYMFVHGGIMHLVMNLVIQIFLGVALELVHNWRRVALIYLAGVAAGSMGTSLSNPKFFLVGASSGVYALISAHVATVLMNWKEMEYVFVQLMVFLVFILSDLGTSIYHHVTVENDQIGYVAHLYGALAGLLIGICVLRSFFVRKWEKISYWIAIVIYFALMGTGMLLHIFYPEYFPDRKPYDNNF